MRGRPAKGDVPIGFLSRQEVHPYLAQLMQGELNQADLANDKALYIALGLRVQQADLYELSSTLKPSTCSVSTNSRRAR